MSEEKNELKSNIIIAPHPDDEAIGVYEHLFDERNNIIIYSGDTPADRRVQALKLKEHVKVFHQLFLQSIPLTFLNKNNKFFVPDPIYEIHPKHREWGSLGEKLAREGYDITFYTTNMNAPYIHEVKEPLKKKELLEKVYPDQKSLWEFDHKYFLFEGYCKWIF